MSRSKSVYDGASIEKIKKVSETPADENVFRWYDGALPARLAGYHVVDWGAGVGRFAEYCLNRGASSLTLVEPSAAGYENLAAKLGNRPADILLEHHGIGIPVRRLAVPERTLHLCNFVINCFDSPGEALEKLCSTALPGEILHAVSNVFAPEQVANRLDFADPFRSLEIALSDLEAWRPQGVPPRTFSNQIIESGAILEDRIHLISRYARFFRELGDRAQVLESSVMPPCGFRHLRQPGEDFRGMTFVVLALRFVLRKVGA